MYLVNSPDVLLTSVEKKVNPAWTISKVYIKHKLNYKRACDIEGMHPDIFAGNIHNWKMISLAEWLAFHTGCNYLLLPI